MKRHAVESLQSAIEAHSERRSIDDLAAQGKRHVRVVSKKRVLALIGRIVDETIEREALEMAAKDRDRIVAQTREQVDRALRDQSEQDAKMREQRGHAEQLENELSEGAWIVAPVSREVVFEVDTPDMWDRVLRGMGIEPSTLVATRGVH